MGTELEEEKQDWIKESARKHTAVTLAQRGNSINRPPNLDWLKEWQIDYLSILGHSLIYYGTCQDDNTLKIYSEMCHYASSSSSNHTHYQDIFHFLKKD